jgi:hypothetical protein
MGEIIGVSVEKKYYYILTGDVREEIYNITSILPKGSSAEILLLVRTPHRVA